ncbi:MAG: rod shape-determining protein MreC [Flavonifractor plautii]
MWPTLSNLVGIAYHAGAQRHYRGDQLGGGEVQRCFRAGADEGGAGRAETAQRRAGGPGPGGGGRPPENERLRNLLELQPKEWSCDKAAAMVTARSTSNWESTLTIGKGSAAGIAVDDCVVDEYWNLVGVVAEVGENWATVRTLVDSDTEMGGQLARTGGAAILEGDFALMGEGRLKLTYLPENSELIAGDLVTTSGRGGVYPAGLVAGPVEEVRTDASGMTRYAVIAPETDLDGLQQVFVITDFTVNE